MSGVELRLPGALERAVRVRLARLDAEGFEGRLDRRDPTLWGRDPARQKVAANRLGWLVAPVTMRAQTEALRAFASEIRGEGFTRAVLLGMGGSSLAPEVLRRSLGVAPGFLDLEVLDNTSPAAVQAIVEGGDPARTLFLVSSKSGATIEVSCFEKVAFAWVAAARGEQAGRAFVAITDPATPLVPAALIGADLDAVLDAASRESAMSEGDASAERNDALRLGAALGELALAGRDKVTLHLGAPLEALGSWIEQLLAESTGKEGKGLVPIVDEPLGPPSAYGADRVIVSVTVGVPVTEVSRRLQALEDAGHPVLSWSRADANALGAEFMRWEKATAVAGAVLDIDPFDEPNVSEAKQATQALLDRFLAAGELPRPAPIAAARGVEVVAPAAIAETLRPHVSDASDPFAWAAATAGLARPGDYFALLAYLHETPERRTRLERLRELVRGHSGLATTLGFGPRFQHSTGQLHKGGPNRGVFLQIVTSEGDRPIPGERYGFRTLQRAQALGDYQVLERRGRRVVRLDLGEAIEPGLDALAETFAAATRA
ncbi:MAG: glucose-6-phosphate isomerase [Candidatus Eisenbacteria bacterium]|uniref:Glucose-6-phosphate isomerase n=1 Tax=Eiseniibacteriota bacterium TaxID=2212470 RepID=A0A538U904_UNCEI|nr:MAG: glucose-6-phosphate isomerase [Candidatus Eisenbacteria bacterium]